MNKNNCQLPDLRQGNLSGARTLRLSGLKQIPDEIFDLADSLEILDLSDGFLSSLPHQMNKLKKLKILLKQKFLKFDSLFLVKYVSSKFTSFIITQHVHQ